MRSAVERFRSGRLRIAGWLVLACVAAGATLRAEAAASADCRTWPAWDGFAATFLTDTGRVIDATTPSGQTTSEGQSYALFFALAANDRARFAQILTWTEENMAGGDLSARLPGWLWGKRGDGSWGIIDDNPATDADLWIAYALQEAGRLWREPRYTALGQLVSERVLREETVVLDGLGRLPLPAPKGFQPAPGTARFNPSYVPLQVLRRLAGGAIDPESKAQWLQQVAPARRMIVESAPRGFAPDWIAYTTARGFLPDQDSNAVGSYNAIRTYLWAGMLAADEPERGALLKALAPMLEHTRRTGAPPQKVDTRSGAVTGTGDSGFSAALLPLLMATNSPAAALQRARIVARAPLSRRDNYYEQALTLFGLGWADGIYRFAGDGMLKVRWPCNGR